MKKSDIYFIVNQYIGVNSGYLGDFNYRTHYEFYREYCDLEFDPYKMEGTTREKFIKILETSDPKTQARILRGNLKNIHQILLN